MTPIQYFDRFVENPNDAYHQLLTTLDWVHVSPTTPRKEYYWHELGLPYTYGTGIHARTYQSQPLHPIIEQIGIKLAKQMDVNFDVVFLNRYDSLHDHLGWHADDSVEMSNDHPIVTVSLGAERFIWFRSNDEPTIVDKVLLQHGSACVMLPGMQKTHQHRIPKHDRPCDTRISLTYRVFNRSCV